MMKKITLLLIFLTVSFGYSQTDVIENFDGAAPTLEPDNGECADNPIGLAVSSTQAASGPNSLEIIASAAAHPWQGAKVILQGDGMDLTTQLLVDVDVYSTVAAGILAKATDGTGPDSASDASHSGSGWETLSFNFSEGLDGTTTANGEYAVLRFYPLWSQAGGYAGQGATQCVSDAPITIYIDNIIGTAPAAATCDDGIQNGDETGVDCGGSICDACPPPPSPEVLEDFDGPAPTVNVTDGPLLSATITTDPAGRAGGNVLEIVSAAAGDPWQAANLLMQNNMIDLTSDTTVSVDVYSLSPINVLAKVIDAGATDSATDSAHGGTGWETLLFDFSDWKDNTGAPDGQYGTIAFFPSWVGGGNGNNGVNNDWNDPVDGITFYVDDITAVAGITLSTEGLEITSFKVFPNPTSNNWTVKTKNQDISSIQVFDILGKNVLSLTPNAREAKIDASRLTTGLYFAHIETISGVSSVKLVKQ